MAYSEPKYVVTVSYPTWDRYYRGQRTFAIYGANRETAIRRALNQSSQGSRIIRCTGPYHG